MHTGNRIQLNGIWNAKKLLTNSKELFTTTPILAYANFGKPFKLHTGASVSGLGAVLYQVQDGVKKVITYTNQSLSKSKSKYPIHKLEFLCLKWGITDQFHKYLYDNIHLMFFMDNNPLTYVLTTAKLDAMGHRWIAGLVNYNFHIHYKLGKCDEAIQADSIQAIVAAAITGNVANHIEAVHVTPPTIDSILPSIPGTLIISKAINRSSGQSHPTHPESESSITKTVSSRDSHGLPIESKVYD